MKEIILKNTTIELMNKYNFWCLENVGPQGMNTWEWTLKSNGMSTYQAIRFNDEYYATLFTLTFKV